MVHSLGMLIHSGVSFIAKAFITVVGYFLSILFILIPTLLLNSSDQIPYLEKDLCLTFPAKYDVVDKYEDWLAFEQHQKIIFRFEDSELKHLTDQVKTIQCEQGSWIQKADILEFEKKFTDKDTDFYTAKILVKDKTLEYNYSSY